MQGTPPPPPNSAAEPEGDGEAGVPDEALPEGEEGGVSVGDLVVIPVPRVREQVGCGERVGVVLEDRRHAVKAFFPDIDRAFWLDREKLLAVAEGRLPAHPLATRIHRACRLLDAALVEIYDREGDAEVLHVYTRGTDLDAVLAVREMLGADFRRVGIDPGGVRRARITLVFKA